MTDLDAEKTLYRELKLLDVDDILALAYAFRARSDRLRLYLNALRQRQGDRAQFAATLICYDLARGGDRTARSEVTLLMTTMRSVAEDSDLVRALVAGHDYLEELWAELSEQLAQWDPRYEENPSLSAETDWNTVSQVDLLDDSDFEDLGISVEEEALRAHFEEAVDHFLGAEPGMPVYDLDAGFRLRTPNDIERMETFLRELDSLHAIIPEARGYRALLHLFYGTHLRSRGLFGGTNERKASLLRQGLEAFCAHGDQMWRVVGSLGPLHAEPSAWDKVSEVLVDYVLWLGEGHGAEPLSAYDPVHSSRNAAQRDSRFYTYTESGCGGSESR